MSVKNKMRLFLSGQKSFGLATFQLLRKLGHEIIGVAAPRSDSKGKPDSLFEYANAWRVPIVASDNLRAESLPDDTDLIVAAHSHAFIGRKTRNKSTHGAIGYHPSLLPRHRGRDSVKWTIRFNDSIGGGTVFWLNDSVDAGEIAAQEFVFIEPQWDAHTLWREQLFPLGLYLFERVLTDIEAGKIVKIPQNERCATWEPTLSSPPLFRPELPQLASAVSTAQNSVKYQVESDFKKATDFYAIR